MAPLAVAVRTGSMQVDGLEGLEEKVAELLKCACGVWCSVNVLDEAPTPVWLKEYLSKDIASGIYKAFTKMDLM